MALVLWSGGCDSTLVLLDLLAAESKKKPKDRVVHRTLSIVHPQVLAKDESLHARRRIESWIKKQDYRSEHREIAINFFESRGGWEGVNGGHGNGLPQPAIWLTSAMSYLRHDEDLYAGYIHGDDFWHYKAQFVAAFYSLQEIMDKKGRLCFPLEWEPKSEVIRRLRVYGVDNLCWFCEAPVNYEACGKCHPCEVHKHALEKLDGEKRTNLSESPYVQHKSKSRRLSPVSQKRGLIRKGK